MLATPEKRNLETKNERLEMIRNLGILGNVFPLTCAEFISKSI